MKHAYIHLFLLLFGSTLLDAKEPIVLDLTAQHPQLQTVIDTGVQSKPITEGGTQMVFKPALYEVKIRGGVRFLIDCFYMEYTKTKIKYCSDDSIIPRKERDDHSRLGYLTLQANDMTYEEAQVMDAFLKHLDWIRPRLTKFYQSQERYHHCRILQNCCADNYRCYRLV